MKLTDNVRDILVGGLVAGLAVFFGLCTFSDGINRDLRHHELIAKLADIDREIRLAVRFRRKLLAHHRAHHHNPQPHDHNWQ